MKRMEPRQIKNVSAETVDVCEGNTRKKFILPRFTGVQEHGMFSSWIKINRNRLKTKDILKKVNAKLRGYYSYFGYWCNRNNKLKANRMESIC